ncbi:acylphosphatase [Oleisolibacter albus]|uniref:acylphosphatase n=1 Tax=Oleisolibacter albus TaxID=2171757 RepID=UPI000DF232BF|nr:acylphosphatase [Oleisolibacter albus]
MNGRIAVRACISGHVQGVWFRGWAIQRAELLGLDGWVRNRRDGTVEALFAGPVGVVETMLADCQDGPPAAEVASIVTETADDPGFIGFVQRPTV